jgi:chromate transporter
MKRYLIFLWDIFLCSLASFGGPEAHYGVFSNKLVQKKHYVDEQVLSEMIGVFALVPGPSSTQTIMAIGYVVGGPWLAAFTFLVWAFPAIVTMMLIGLFFPFFQSLSLFQSLGLVLPAIAIGFIFYAGWSLSKKTIRHTHHLMMFLIIGLIGYWLLPISIWSIPVLLILSGFWMMRMQPSIISATTIHLKPKWWLIVGIILIAVIVDVVSPLTGNLVLRLFASFYRYGYTVIGGGQIVIPLMIQDLVTQQAVISLETFLSGYAIDQAIPGPLFSFAAFVAVQSLILMPNAWLTSIGLGVVIFLPGILLVYFVFPIYQQLRQMPMMKRFLQGVSIAASSFIALTAITQLIALTPTAFGYGVILLTFGLLISKKIPAPLIVLIIILISAFI